MAKGKPIKEPKNRAQSLQAIINYLVDNGMSDMQANMLIHTNMPSFGGNRNLVDVIREGDWDLAWNTMELYINGDLW